MSESWEVSWSEMDEVGLIMGRIGPLLWAGLLVVTVLCVAGSLFNEMWWRLGLAFVWGGGVAFVLRRATTIEHHGLFYLMLLTAMASSCLFIISAHVVFQVMPAVFIVMVVTLFSRLRKALLSLLIMGACVAFSVQYVREGVVPQSAIFVFPVIAPGLFAMVLRSSLLSRERAEQMAGRLAQVNEALQHALRASDELVIARERTRMARELHDSIGHAFTIGSIQLEAAQRMLGHDEARVDEALAQAKASMTMGLEELRSCVKVLREDDQTYPLLKMMHELVEGATQAGLAIEFEIQGQERQLQTAYEFACFRAFQEALTNTIKHAQASTMCVQLSYHQDHLKLTVQDDGIGTAQIKPGHGIQGLRERIESLGGDVRLSSAPGDGFCVSLLLPYSLPG